MNKVIPLKLVDTKICACGTLLVYAGVDASREDNAWPAVDDSAEKVGVAIQLKWNPNLDDECCCYNAQWKQWIQEGHEDWKTDALVKNPGNWYNPAFAKSWGKFGHTKDAASLSGNGFMEDYPGLGNSVGGIPNHYKATFVSQVYCLDWDETPLATVVWSYEVNRPLFSSDVTVSMTGVSWCGGE